MAPTRIILPVVLLVSACASPDDEERTNYANTSGDTTTGDSYVPGDVPTNGDSDHSSNVPGSWTCSDSLYDEGAGGTCDCRCGAHDPDCDDESATLTGCGGQPEATCSALGECEGDLAHCLDIVPAPANERQYEFNITGNDTFDILDSDAYAETGSDYVILFNDWNYPECGSFEFTDKWDVEVGTHFLTSSDFEVVVRYDDRVYSSDNEGTSGLLYLDALEWCMGWECRHIELQIDGTLATETGETIAIEGWIYAFNF